MWNLHGCVNVIMVILCCFVVSLLLHYVVRRHERDGVKENGVVVKKAGKSDRAALHPPRTHQLQ